MKVYEAAKLLERDSKELAEEIGMKSHLSNIPDDVLVKLGLETPDEKPAPAKKKPAPSEDKI